VCCNLEVSHHHHVCNFRFEYKISYKMCRYVYDVYHMRFHTLSSDSSLDIATRSDVKSRFHMATVLFYMLHKILRWNSFSILCTCTNFLKGVGERRQRDIMLYTSSVGSGSWRVTLLAYSMLVLMIICGFISFLITVASHLPVSSDDSVFWIFMTQFNF
jgi:hypothetical protein